MHMGAGGIAVHWDLQRTSSITAEDGKNKLHSSPSKALTGSIWGNGNSECGLCQSTALELPHPCFRTTKALEQYPRSMLRFRPWDNTTWPIPHPWLRLRLNPGCGFSLSLPLFPSCKEKIVNNGCVHFPPPLFAPIPPSLPLQSVVYVGMHPPQNCNHQNKISKNYPFFF